MMWFTIVHDWKPARVEHKEFVPDGTHTGAVLRAWWTDSPVCIFCGMLEDNINHGGRNRSGRGTPLKVNAATL